MKTVYSYNPNTFEFNGETIAQKDPMEKEERFLIPTNATEKQPSFEEGKITKFVDGVWVLESIPEPKPEPEPTLEEAKDKKKAEIKALRDKNLLLPTPLTIELGGLNKQFNVKSVDLLMFGTIITVLSQSEGSTRSWQAGDGVRYELTVNDYRSLVNHLISRDELEFFQAKLKIAALSLLNTAEEIEAFDINEIIIS